MRLLLLRAVSLISVVCLVGDPSVIAASLPSSCISSPTAFQFQTIIPVLRRPSLMSGHNGADQALAEANIARSSEASSISSWQDWFNSFEVVWDAQTEHGFVFSFLPTIRRKELFRPVHFLEGLSEGDFRALNETLAAGGGLDAIGKQHKKKRLTARERIDLLKDKDSTFVEVGLHVAHKKYGGKAPGAGVLIGFVTVNGHEVVVVANDATVKAGAWWPETIGKMLRAQMLAIRYQRPIVYLVDSSGVNLPFQEGVFPGQYGAARIFFYNTIMRLLRRTRQISVVMGPCIAGGAYLPALSDVILMVEGAFMALAGPLLVQAAVGQVADPEELGGAHMHVEKSKVAHVWVASDEEAIQKVRKRLTPSVKPKDLPKAVPATHPGSTVRATLFSLVDDPESMMPVEPVKAGNPDAIRMAIATVDGKDTALIGIRPDSIDADSIHAATEFVRQISNMKIPVIYVEKGDLQAPAASYPSEWAQLAEALAMLPVPKIALITAPASNTEAILARQSFDLDFTFAWSNGNANPESADPMVLASEAFIDALIEPADSRASVIHVLRALHNDAQPTATFKASEPISKPIEITVESHGTSQAADPRAVIQNMTDPDSLFMEIGEDVENGEDIVTGIGEIEGRLSVIISCTGPTWTLKGVEKISRAQEIAIRNRIPVVYLLDSNQTFNALPLDALWHSRGAGRIIWQSILMRHKFRIPQLVVSHPGEGMAHRFLRQVSGIRLDGLPCDAKEAIRKVFSDFPAARPKPASGESATVFSDDAEAELIPKDPLKDYSLDALVSGLFDKDSFQESFPWFASEMVTATATIDGQTVSIIANRPGSFGKKRIFRGGVIYKLSALKVGAYIWYMQKMHPGRPLVFLQDVSGFMVGTADEQEGIIRAGAYMVEAMATTTLPKIVVTIRKASGAGYYAMGAQGFDPDFLFTLPTGNMGVMSGPTAVLTLYGNLLKEKGLLKTPMDVLTSEGFDGIDAATKAEIKKILADYERYLEAGYAAKQRFVDAVVRLMDLRKWLSFSVRVVNENAGPKLPVVLETLPGFPVRPLLAQS